MLVLSMLMIGQMANTGIRANNDSTDSSRSKEGQENGNKTNSQVACESAGGTWDPVLGTCGGGQTDSEDIDNIQLNDKSNSQIACEDNGGSWDFATGTCADGTVFPEEDLDGGYDISVVSDSNIQDDLNIAYELKGATYFDGTPWSGTTQKIREYNREVPYNGWQLMQLTVEIPYQDGLEITSIQPSAETLYPEYSEIKKDDKNSKWTYTFYFYDNGIYDFTINYSLNGTEHSVTKSYPVEGLVPIKDVAMRRHLINTYGEFTGLSYQGGQYVTKDILATPQYDPWGNLVFDFGKDGDNGSTAKYTTSLDGLQYLTNIHGMYLFDCSKLAKGETIEPITKAYYPNLKQLRITEISESQTNLPKDSYTPEMITKAISNMPNLGELSLSGTGFKDFSVVNQLNGHLYYVKCNYNEVESIEGIQKHKEIGTLALGKNKIKSIEPLGKSNFDELRFLDLGGNQIFDLSPMKTTLPSSITAGQTFSAKSQNIAYDKTVITSLENDVYKVELPMPIDIDGTLTDADEVEVEYGNGSLKKYKTTKLDGKTYIAVPKNDVDSNKENPFEDTKFTFSFNNNNGNDARTKSWFTGTVEFKSSPFVEEYPVIYEFESGTAGKELPKEILDILPDDPQEYEMGEKVTAIQPDFYVLETDEGTWTFKGYEEGNEEIVSDATLHTEPGSDEEFLEFTGIWTFVPTEKYTVTYTDGVDDEVVFEDQVTSDLAGGEKTPEFVGTPTRKGYTFVGWNPEVAETVTATATYTAQWKKDETGGGTTPTEKYTVTYTDGVDDEVVFEDQVTSDLASGEKTPEFNGTPTRKGYTFVGWNPEVAETVTATATYTAQWKKDETGGGTTPTEKYTVTYTDGVDDEVVFEDQVTGDLASGEKTPEFVGTPTRKGYTFVGWNPEVAETVTATATYTAQWKKDETGGGTVVPTPTYYKVTYTDGVEGEEVFEDQVTKGLSYGEKTPAFEGAPTRAGYRFIGWEPKVSEVVKKSAIYEARWEKIEEEEEQPLPPATEEGNTGSEAETKPDSDEAKDKVPDTGIRILRAATAAWLASLSVVVAFLDRPKKKK